MSSRYAEVARTYLRQWWVWAMIVVMIGYTWIVFRHEPSAGHRDPRGLVWEMTMACVLIYIILASCFAGFVAAHLKEQMAHWRSTLLPGFRTPHIVVAAIAILLLALLP